MNTHYGYAYHFDSLGFSFGQDVETEVTERPDKSHAMQVKVSASFGVVRIQGPGVVRMTISETKRGDQLMAIEPATVQGIAAALFSAGITGIALELLKAHRNKRKSTNEE